MYNDGTPPPDEGLNYYIIEPKKIKLRNSCGELCACSNVFAFLNRYGVYETFTTGCDAVVDREVYENIGEQCIDCTDRNLLLTQQTHFQATRRVTNKGYSEIRTVFAVLPSDENNLAYLKSFLYSAKVFRLSDDKTTWIPCKINTKTRTLSTNRDRLNVRIQYELFFPRHSVKR